MEGFWSIRINDQWRVIFRFDNGGAKDVKITQTTTKTLNNVHPGEVLKEEFLVPMNISAYKLAKEIKVPETRLSAIVNCKQAVTADTAIRLSRFFGTTPDFWLNLQSMYDIEEQERIKSAELDEIKQYATA